MKGSVTVIIPCFNVERFIAEALDSVLAQGTVVEKVHCVDNGSQDDTVDAVKQWIATHPDFLVELEHESRRGACAARNRPLERVTTEWVQYLDADDLLLPGKLEAQVRDAGDADVICEQTIHRAVDGSERIKVPLAEVEVGLMAGNLGNTCANLWRTSKLVEVDGWDAALSSSQEYDLMLRIYEAGGRFVNLPGVRTVVRERATGQISQGDPVKRWRQLVEVQVRMLEVFRSRSVSPERMEAVHQAFFGGLRTLYPYDAERAVELWQRYLAPSGFQPYASALNTNSYIWAYRLLGFRGAERVKAMLRRCRRTHVDRAPH